MPLPLHSARVQLYMSQRKGQPCILVATETTHAEGPRFLYLSQRWLPLVLSIKGEYLPHLHHSCIIACPLSASACPICVA